MWKRGSCCGIDFYLGTLKITAEPDPVALCGQYLVCIKHLAERSAAVEPLVMDAGQDAILAADICDDEVLLAVAHVDDGPERGRWWRSRVSQEEQRSGIPRALIA